MARAIMTIAITISTTTNYCLVSRLCLLPSVDILSLLLELSNLRCYSIESFDKLNEFF
jgi:hypothetical protein